MVRKFTKEKQYQFLLERKRSNFGLMSSQVWQDDPKRLCFLLSRYKFVAKILSGKKNVLEIGCADGFGSRVVLQEVSRLTAVDFDPVFIKNAKKISDKKWPVKFSVHNILNGPVISSSKFDACFCCDVLEHISKKHESTFFKNLTDSISKDAVAVIGTPSLESQIYASPPSKEGHVNCKSGKDLRSLMKKYFNNVIIFSMNDEVVHTGFFGMAHYLFAIGTNKIEPTK